MATVTTEHTHYEIIGRATPHEEWSELYAGAMGNEFATPEDAWEAIRLVKRSFRSEPNGEGWEWDIRRVQPFYTLDGCSECPREVA